VGGEGEKKKAGRQGWTIPPRSGRWTTWSRGEKVYAANCAACHQASGKGAGPSSRWTVLPSCWMPTRAKQIAVLLNGQNNGAMPAWKQLSDTDIAAVITYTKNNWSNKTGQLVQPAEVWPSAASKPIAARKSIEKETNMSAVLDHGQRPRTRRHITTHPPAGAAGCTPPTTRTSARCTCCSRSPC
jgi:cytochrome c